MQFQIPCEDSSVQPSGHRDVIKAQSSSYQKPVVCLPPIGAAGQGAKGRSHLKKTVTSSLRPVCQSTIRSMSLATGRPLSSRARGPVDHLPINQRFISFDVCETCKVQMYMDRERAATICPRCAKTMPYLMHVSAVRSADVDDGLAARRTDSTHMFKSLSQYQLKAHPLPPRSVLANVVSEYRVRHAHGVSAPFQASTMLKNTPDASYRHRADVIDRMIRGQGIPMFSDAQVQRILHIRKLLHKLEQDNRQSSATATLSSTSSSTCTGGKSQHNAAYFAAISYAMNNSVARLFQHDKTPVIHARRMKEFEDAFRKLQDATGTRLIMFPCT
jgi:hypothetical protein